MYHNVRDVRFWHKADIVQANVCYERRAEVRCCSRSQIVALLTLRRVNQRGAGHSLFLFLVVDWLSKFYQNRSSKMSVLHQQDSLK